MVLLCWLLNPLEKIHWHVALLRARYLESRESSVSDDLHTRGPLGILTLRWARQANACCTDDVRPQPCLILKQVTNIFTTVYPPHIPCRHIVATYQFTEFKMSVSRSSSSSQSPEDQALSTTSNSDQTPRGGRVENDGYTCQGCRDLDLSVFPLEILYDDLARNRNTGCQSCKLLHAIFGHYQRPEEIQFLRSLCEPRIYWNSGGIAFTDPSADAKFCLTTSFMLYAISGNYSRRLLRSL